MNAFTFVLTSSILTVLIKSDFSLFIFSSSVMLSISCRSSASNPKPTEFTSNTLKIQTKRIQSCPLMSRMQRKLELIQMTNSDYCKQPGLVRQACSHPLLLRSSSYQISVPTENPDWLCHPNWQTLECKMESNLNSKLEVPYTPCYIYFGIDI